MKDINIEIKEMINKYKDNLDKKVLERIEEMKKDNTEHYLMYNALGVDDNEGNMIDIYQNKGRFLFKYAGAVLEEATKMCFKHKYSNAQKLNIPNTISSKPKNVEIDCLVDDIAYEIKWRDATTDGDHINKEHTRVKVIKDRGYTPVRLMFFEPNRKQAIKIQEKLKSLYLDVGGQYYSGEDAWNFVKNETGVNLKGIFEDIANENLGR